MSLAKDDDVVKTIPSDRADQSLHIWILPWRPSRDRAVPNSHRPDPTCEGLPIGAIIVAHQIGRRCIPRECLNDLLCQPLRCRIPGHREPKQLTPTVTQDKKRKQAFKRQGWHHAEINRRDAWA